MNAALATAISNAATQVGATAASLTAASRAYSLYEGFVFACVVEALARLGAQFEVRDHDDNSATTLVFRTKPGLIFTPGVPYTFVYAQLPSGAEYELHSTLRSEGRSKVLHELDVALVERAEAVRCRQAGISPRAAKVKLLAECKFYGRSLPLHLGREYLGLSSEFRIRVKTIVSNVRSDHIGRMIASQRGTENFDVSPMTPGKVVRFVEWVAKELEQVL
ncbi:MAG: hypothetical protein KC766_13335 [Myxococcales bacterium]|nr:hypothetical protein [Myxococcales bacterium]